MAWDRLEPQNNTKLRNGPGVIRDNFQSIDSQDSSFKPIGINFSDRNVDVLAPSVNPTAIADTFITYCKKDTDGNSALFGMDPSSVITQFTDSQRSLAQTGYAVIPPGILVHWGRITMNSGVSTASVTFAPGPNYSATPWIVHVTPYNNPVPGGGSNAREAGADNISTTGFDVRLFNGNTTTNTVFGYLVLGPR